MIARNNYQICSIKYLPNVFMNFLKRLDSKENIYPSILYKSVINLFIINYWPVCAYPQIFVRYQPELCMDDMFCY